MTAQALLAALEQAGLTGRGGAGFGTATKVRAALDQGAELIVNACDGELGAGKDAFVIERHLAELVHGAGLVGGAAVRFAAHRGTRTEANLLRCRPGCAVGAGPVRFLGREFTGLTGQRWARPAVDQAGSGRLRGPRRRGSQASRHGRAQR